MDARLLNPLTLAYMGDTALDQHACEYIIPKLQSRPNRLHQVSEQHVFAKNRVQALEVLITKEWLTEEERDIVRRGHDTRSYTKAKNIDIRTYRKNSGLKAIIGLLYLDHQNERLDALLDMIVQVVGERLRI